MFTFGPDWSYHVSLVLVLNSIFSHLISSQLLTILFSLPPRFAVTEFTHRENGGKIPVTKGKTGNYRLPIGKLSLPTEIFGSKGKFEKVKLQ